jgi:hypothetical protein
MRKGAGKQGFPAPSPFLFIFIPFPIQNCIHAVLNCAPAVAAQAACFNRCYEVACFSRASEKRGFRLTLPLRGASSLRPMFTDFCGNQ